MEKEEIQKDETYTRCKYCGRKLKTNEAKQLGYGKRFFEKHHKILKQNENLLEGKK